jgi:hypothetical protein
MAGLAGNCQSYATVAIAGHSKAKEGAPKTGENMKRRIIHGVIMLMLFTLLLANHTKH